jgi:hypothetical protein
MNMKMKRLLIALLTASVASSASAIADNQKALQSKADSANAKRGVEIGGSIRAVAQRSNFSTDQDADGLNKMPDVERNEFVSADLSFGFRPYESVRANVIMRLGGGMQEYFAAAAKTLEAKWLNVEGNVGKNFYWTVGDFRQEISPLTIFNPGVEIMYEPTVFARKRHMAQKEQLLEGNKRNLQGVNLQFRQEIDPMIGELRAEALLARVNRVSVLDFSGAEGNILPNDEIEGTSLASNTDKWLVAGNFELLPLHKNVYVGVTPMLVFDNENTKSYAYKHPKDDAGNYVFSQYDRMKINPYDTALQNTFVLSARVGADVANILQNKNLVLDLVAEYAMSMDKVEKLQVTTDPVTALPVYSTNKETVNGSAVLVNLNIGYKVENSWNASLALDLVRNDSAWFNNLAQSPSFFAQRILNSDKDGNTVKYGVNSPLYSTFDALYNYSPKFTPVSRELGTDDNATRDGQTESYNIAPYNKNSWGSNVYSRAQLALLNEMTDPAVQLTLPNGLATANRMGVRALIKGDWQEKVEGQALVSVFNQVKSTSPYVDKVSFMEVGAGAKVDIAKFIAYDKTLDLSGSFKHSESTAKFIADPNVQALLGGTETKIKSDFINAGVSAQFLPRLGVTAGFQMINTDYGINSLPNSTVGRDIPLMKSKQIQVMGGFDYTVAPNAWLSINVGYVKVQNDYNTKSYVDTYTAECTAAYEKAYSAELAKYKSPSEDQINFAVQKGKDAVAKVKVPNRNLPDYNQVSVTGESTYSHKFSQLIFESSINVEF